MIFAFSYALAMLFTQIGVISSGIDFDYFCFRTKQPEVVRTASETNFILSDYGAPFEPRKLGRKERLALAFTNMAESGQ